ncbi:MAG: spore coat protein [Clostridia bacterium]|nr:spore coat protein [Clostridia bacterium]
MKNLSDKDILNVLLDQHKHSASSMTNMILESNNQFLRNDATNILTKVFQHQKQIYDLMTQKGWYQVQNASQQDVSRAQQDVSNIQSSTSM